MTIVLSAARGATIEGESNDVECCRPLTNGEWMNNQSITEKRSHWWLVDGEAGV